MQFCSKSIHNRRKEEKRSQTNMIAKASWRGALESKFRLWRMCLDRAGKIFQMRETATLESLIQEIQACGGGGGSGASRGFGQAFHQNIQNPGKCLLLCLWIAAYLLDKIESEFHSAAGDLITSYLYTQMMGSTGGIFRISGTEWGKHHRSKSFNGPIKPRKYFAVRSVNTLHLPPLVALAI